MKAVILAAGQGTRLKKYTENLPKGMLCVQGKTIIERQLELYRSCGIDQIIIIRGYAAEKIGFDGVRYYTNEHYAETNMVESFMTARAEFDDDIILSYSDILFSRDMLLSMTGSGKAIAVAVDGDWKKYWLGRYGRVDFDTESLILDKDNNIVSLGLENPPLEEIDARYIGLLKFSKDSLKLITGIWDKNYEIYRDKPWQQSGKTIRKAYMTDLLNALIESGEKVGAEIFSGGWVEFDTNEDYEKVCGWIENKTIDSVIGKNVII